MSALSINVVSNCFWQIIGGIIMTICHIFSNFIFVVLFLFDLDFGYSCCVFWPAFGYFVHPKVGQNTFFGRFQPISLILDVFNTVNLQINNKKMDLYAARDTKTTRGLGSRMPYPGNRIFQKKSVKFPVPSIQDLILHSEKRFLINWSKYTTQQLWPIEFK